MTTRRGLLLLALLAALQPHAYARGVTPYLPLNLDPEVEREVERVLVLGGKPVMTRPIPAAVVLDALPKACEVDAVLCSRVRRALKQYMQDTAVEFTSVAGAITNGSKTVMPNQHGETAQSPFQVAGAAYIQPSAPKLPAVDFGWWAESEQVRFALRINVLFLIGVGLAPLLAWILRSTRWGLTIRLAGESTCQTRHSQSPPPRA